MSSRCLDVAAALLALALACGAVAVRADEARPHEARTLRVCADPDNLPYSNRAEAGFENRIARLVADELKASLTYAWQPLGRGFVRKTLGSQLCDVFIGVPAGFERVLTTRPYYRSGYVFVNRAEADAVVSFDDPRLPQLRIGVQLIGNDLAATPPGYALARHGAIDRVVGYTIMGDGPAAERIVHDLENGALDAALVWGPQAGYFAKHSARPLRITPAAAPPDTDMPFEFAIAMGVAKTDRALRDDLDAVIAKRASDIAAILDDYGVPRASKADAGRTATPTPLAASRSAPDSRRASP